MSKTKFPVVSFGMISLGAMLCLAFLLHAQEALPQGTSSQEKVSQAGLSRDNVSRDSISEDNASRGTTPDPCKWSPWQQEGASGLSQTQVLSKLEEELALKKLCLERQKISDSLNKLAKKNTGTQVTGSPIIGSPKGAVTGRDLTVLFGDETDISSFADPSAVPSSKARRPGFYFSSVRIVSLGGIEGLEEITVSYKGKNFALQRGSTLPDGKGSIHAIKYQGSKVRVLAKESAGSISTILWAQKEPLDDLFGDNQASDQTNDPLLEDIFVTLPPASPINLLDGSLPAHNSPESNLLGSLE